ncbi:hypothetical protein HBH53_029980 [Parastagonospora nodorum]|nr:hypothetical protein HBH53_029980 [Parastagonospora nodorum]KAH4036346.1 hypothetical protein HBI09_085880 [Parastagonospora nodorum]KAH4074915.1 hypothetical protein HBH50_031450 [Parastagonospora nodorum]KAH4096975.1 hypothetical protein HBH48_040330 [Parastagonospora nodorum]KAH4134569.1 hypothetical protein HBH45_165550 [Parastagonospora nodorum]
MVPLAMPQTIALVVGFTIRTDTPTSILSSIPCHYLRAAGQQTFTVEQVVAAYGKAGSERFLLQSATSQAPDDLS